MSRRVIYDFTIYEDDGETPLFGSVVSGALVESDFQTPDDELIHPRPYLRFPENFTGAQVDFLNGSSSIGAVSLGVLDKRTDAADQTTGMVTARIKDIPGKRGRLRRWDDDLSDWRVIFEGVVHTYSVDPEELLVYWFHLRDAREFEREQPLFRSNYVIFGEAFEWQGKTYHKHGPAEDYGVLPNGEPMIPAVGPWVSIAGGGILNFKRGDPLTWFGRTVYWGITPGSADAPAFNLIDFRASTPRDDGYWYFEDFWIRWRPSLTPGAPWTELRDMPRAFGHYAVHQPNQDIPNYSESALATFLHYSVPTLYFGSFDEADLPDDGLQIEFQIMASKISEKSPFWWDGGSLGDLLQEIADGLHTDEVPKERYDADALAAFALSTAPARFILTEPVTDRRRWVEQNIYQAAMYAPAFRGELEISPTSWVPPTNDTAVPILDESTVQPVGEWEHSTGQAVSRVEYTYLREHLEPAKEVADKRNKGGVLGWLGLTEDYTHDDPRQMAWERLTVDPVTVSQDATDPVPGGRVMQLSPVTVRTISAAFATSTEDAGDMRSAAALLLVFRTMSEMIAVWSKGPPTYEARITATPANLELLAGDLVRLRSAYLPDYEDGKRGMRRYMRVTSISDPSPEFRQVALLDMGVPDTSEDDDETGTGEGGSDCLEDTGGDTFPAADSKTVRILSTPGRTYIVNGCDAAVEVDLIVVGGGGGGGGGPGAGGGGGGAGAVLGVDTPITVSIPANTSVAVDIGDGGAGDTSNGHVGEDTVVWIDRVTGLPMDPDVDDPADAYQAIGGGFGGGGGGGGGSGGSGGGGGALLPSGGGGSHAGGTGETDHGNDGGEANEGGGLATCKNAGGGGGGSYGGDGQAGSFDGTVGGASTGGDGGPAYTVPDWGVTVGGGGQGGAIDEAGALGALCASGATIGADGESGLGYGGGGGAGGAGTDGGAGGVALRYEGARLKLRSPILTSVSITDQNQAQICVEGNDWVSGGLEGYRARVEYAVTDPADPEPDATSGEWRLAGYLDAPGCVISPPVKTGGRVWARAYAEAKGYLPSPSSTTDSSDAPETPGLKALRIDAEDGIATARWTANDFADTVVITGLIHAEGDDTTRPLPDLVTLDADVGEYEIGEVAEGDYATIDVQAFFGYDEGRIYRASVQNPTRELITRTDGIDKLSDVELDAVNPGDILVADVYGVFHNQAVRLDEWAEAEDNTDLDATDAHHGLLPKLSGEGGDYLGGDGAWHSVPSGEWTEIIAAADQDVTNNATLQNDAELSFAVTAGVYRIELILLFAGSNTTVDFKYGFTFPSSFASYRAFGATTTGGGAHIFSQANTGTTATDLGTEIQVGTLGAGTFEASMEEFSLMLRVNSPGTVQFKFANNVAAALAVSRRLAGSILRYRKLA